MPRRTPFFIDRRLKILCLGLAREDPRSDSFRALAACSDSETGRRILAKDLARSDITLQSRNGLVTRLAHNDEFPHATDNRLGHASEAKTMAAELVHFQSRPP